MDGKFANFLAESGTDLSNEGMDYAIEFEQTHEGDNMSDIMAQLPEDMPWNIKGLMMESWQALQIIPGAPDENP
jgi:hypothetical protein